MARARVARRDSAGALHAVLIAALAQIEANARGVRLSNDPEFQALPEFGSAALGRAHRKAMKRARGVDWHDAAERHAIRIRVKRLRYSCEFFAAALALRPASAYLSALKALQDILGELNDISVGRQLLRELGPGGDAVARQFAAREAALLTKLVPAWTALEKRGAFWRTRG